MILCLRLISEGAFSKNRIAHSSHFLNEAFHFIKLSGFNMLVRCILFHLSNRYTKAEIIKQRDTQDKCVYL